MLNIYVKTTNTTEHNIEDFIAAAEEHLRFEVNKAIHERGLIVNSVAVKKLARDFVLRTKGLQVLNTREDHYIHEKVYIKVISYSELEDMFRIEREYWVIRNKVLIGLLVRDKTLLIKVLSEGLDASPDDYLVVAGTFREAEQYIAKNLPSARRLSISQTRLKHDTSTIALFKTE